MKKQKSLAILTEVSLSFFSEPTEGSEIVP